MRARLRGSANLQLIADGSALYESRVTRTEPQRREAKSTTLASHSYNFAGTASQLLIQMSGIESRHHESSVGIMWLETKFLRVAFLEIHNTDGIEPSGNFWLSCDIKEA
jgi:hypothetical protein